MNLDLHASWKSALSDEFEQDYFRNLISFVKSEYETEVCYPAAKQIFAALEHCHFDQVKVVIIGQDPYHGPGQANGLCFSVNPGVAIPPSLTNIFKEIKNDLGHPVPSSGDLTRWADQGVLLLNATLTVRAGQAASHQNKGWEKFTDAIIRKINSIGSHVVFLLWGNYAGKKGDFIDQSKHLVLKSPHPSPLSAYHGFFGNRHFSKTNDYLVSHGKEPIVWQND